METPSEVPSTQPKDLSIDPHGGWVDESFVEIYYINIEVNNGNVNEIYYIPWEYPKVMIGTEPFKRCHEGRFFVPKSLSWEIFDFRVTADLNMSSATDKMPVNVQDIGLKIYDTSDDMYIAPRPYPLGKK